MAVNSAVRRRAIMFQGRNAHDGDGKNQGERSAVAFGAVQCDHHGAYIVQMIPANTIARDNRAVPACPYRPRSHLSVAAGSTM